MRVNMSYTREELDKRAERRRETKVGKKGYTYNSKRELLEQLSDKIIAGETSYWDVSIQYGIHYDTIRPYVEKKVGKEFDVKKNRLKTKRDKIVAMREQGLTWQQVAEAMDMSLSGCTRLFREGNKYDD